MFDGTGAALYNDHSWWCLPVCLACNPKALWEVLPSLVTFRTIIMRQAGRVKPYRRWSGTIVPFRSPMNTTESGSLLLPLDGLIILSNPICSDSDLRKGPITGCGQERRP